MHARSLLSLAIPAAVAVATTAAAQEARTRIEPGRAYAFSIREDMDRAVIGVSTSTGSARDTLGVLISSVAEGGPAEKAGIEEGSRIAAINGVNLRLSPADVGDWDMSSALSRRLTRELGKVKAGDEVDLRIYNGGQTRTVKVKTVAYEDLYEAFRRGARDRDRDERPALGVSLGSGSKRDTLGVLVMGLDDDGPAGKAGLEEGNRIQSINGVDLRVPREDAGDGWTGDSKVRRLQRELEKLKVGDEVTLKVYVGGGRTRDFRIKTVAQSDLKSRGLSIFRNWAPMAVPMPRPPMGFEFDGEELRRRIEDGVGRSLESLRLDNLPRVRIENLPRTRIETAPAVRRVITNRIVI